jgi:DNA polymerase III delta prime subunit
LSLNIQGEIRDIKLVTNKGIDYLKFINSKTLFRKGMKFVILDEVDYMTKNAQQALHYLIQNYSSSVRFCLICNYISRIEEGLQNEFLKLRFNQLPKNDIVSFLKNISDKEGLNMPEKSIKLIQNLYGSDMRSMINFMQSNQNIVDSRFNIIDEAVWDDLFNLLVKREQLSVLDSHIQNISINYNIDKTNNKKRSQKKRS